MAEIKKISTELQLLNKFLDTSGDAGSADQVLVSTTTGINWVDGSGSSIIGGPYLPVANPTFTGTLTGPNANFTSTVVVDNMLTITIDDISTGENRGLTLLNEAGTDQQWNITAGTTGITNDDFCIRDSTNNVNALRLSEVTGNATFAGNITVSGNIIASSSSAVIQTPRISMEADGTLDWGQARDYGTLTWSSGYAKMKGQAGKGLIFEVDGGTDALTINTSATATFAGKITASGGINGLTLANGGISGSNYDISGVNQLVISDPGEGIVFTGTATMYLNAVDDATDSILQLRNATQLDLNSTARITNLVDPSGAQDAATKNYVDTEIGTIPSGLSFEGNWNASTDTPSLAGTTPGNGIFYIVSVAGSTSLSGITDWAVGDWAVFVSNGAGTDAWQKVDNSSSLAGAGSAGKVTFWSGTSNVSFNTNFSYDGTNLTAPRMRVGDGTDGYFWSDSAGRTAFAAGDFYIQNTVTNYYNYATRMYLGDTTGDSVLFRGSTITGTNWGITPAGAASFTTGTFTGLVSGITPTSGANFATKSYVDGLTPGAGVFLPLAGGTMAGGINMAGNAISGSNYNITGVNQITINDPGEGIVFTGTTNVNLYVIDDTTDSIVNFDNASEIRRDGVRVADVPYIASRSQQLMTNYNGLLGDNYNFPGFTFDGEEANYSPGSFKFVGSSGNSFTAEYMAVDTAYKYKMSLDAKTLNGVGRYYCMTLCYDVDKLSINAQNHMYRANTSTTLAVALNPGDTTVTLAGTGSNWFDGGTAGVSTHLRSLIIWEYTNSFGYTYPPETYSRLWYPNAWDPNNINGNVITLRVAWTGPSYPIGTQLSNGSSGGSYKYNVMSNTLPTTDWLQYSGFMDGVDLSGTNVYDKFPPGTAQIKMGFLMNYNSGSTGADTIWITNFNVGIDTVLTTGAQSIAGAKTFTSLVSGITPTANANFTTKQYVDDNIPSLTNYVTLDTAQTITGTKTINTLIIGSSAKIQFQNNDFIRYDDSVGVGRFHFDSDGGTNNASVQAATFVGDLNGTINTATTGTTQSAGNNSTLIATTAYADAAAAAVDPSGVYLPLAAGSSNPLTGNLFIIDSLSAGTPLLDLQNTSSGSGATIKFSDMSTVSQRGTITYYHADSASYGSGNSFVITGDQATMTILADGKLMYKEGVYSKPATGTGAGTRKDTLWDSAYNDKITAFSDSGSSTITLTLTQQDAGTLTTSFSNPQGTVESINVVTDGDALNVTSNTITGSGTMTLPWQGGSDQYVNGLGNAIDFPTIPQGTVTGTGTANLITKWNSAGTGIEDTSISVTESGSARLYTINGGAGASSGINILRINKNNGGSGDDSLVFRLGTTQNDIISDNNLDTALLRFRLANAAGTESTILSLNANGNSIFSGNVTVGANTTQNGTNPGLKIQSTNTAQTVLGLHNTTTRNWEVAVGGTANGIGAGSFYIYDNTAADARFIIDTSGNATVDGTVTANGVLLTGGGEGVTSVATTSPILGGTITSTGTISLLQPTSGAWFRGVSVIGSDGLMEVGRYIDFHNSNTGTSDFDVRLDCKTGNLLQLTGSFKTTSNLTINGLASFATTNTDAKVNIAQGTGSVATNVLHASENSFRLSTKVGTNSSSQTTPIFQQSLYYGLTENAGINYYRGGSTTGGRLAFSTNNGTERMFISSSGKIGLNEDSPTALLHVKALAPSGTVFKLIGDPATTANQMLIYTTKAFNSSDTWYNLICEAGNGSGGQTSTCIIERDGDLKNKNNVYGQISDSRLKENIQDATPKLDDIMKVKVKNFNFIGEELKQIGVVAQELEEVFPGLVKEDKQPDLNGEEGGIYKSVKYSVLVPILLKAMQEQQEMIQDLKTRIEQLEN